MVKLLSVRAAAVVVVAVALFAVVGFAAAFSINDDKNIVNAEGETLVVDCNINGDILVEKVDEWRNPTGDSDPGDGGFYVKTIKLSSYSDCAGKYYVVVLTDDDGDKIAAKGGQLAGPTHPSTTTAVDFSGSNVRISKLHDIHVLISDTPQNP